MLTLPFLMLNNISFHDGKPIIRAISDSIRAEWRRPEITRLTEVGVTLVRIATSVTLDPASSILYRIQAASFRLGVMANIYT